MDASIRASRLAMLLLLLTALALPTIARAHCDTMDGPVVTAARQALEQRDVGLALIWVQRADEPTIRDAFAHTLAVRRLGPQARELADHWFFETLVRLHRAGEGAPFTGLQPAGRDLGPAIPAADRALETGDLAPLSQLLVDALRKGLEQRFQAARAARHYARDDVAAGREYVECYVSFIHQAESIWQAASLAPEGHYQEAAAVEPPTSRSPR